MDYSKTVNLPSTDFPMRGNLPKKEPGIVQKWEDERIYDKIQESRKGAELYILHDGPPYANGHLHLGHALNKILKDIIVKHKTMMGFRSPYVPGWDCHGLPIELNVTKELGDKAKEMPKVEIRKRCRDYAEKFVGIQMEEFKRLGVFGDYDHPYKTMAEDYEATIVETFGKIMKEGYIYKNKKPIYWCPTCVTALAEAEVEYDMHTSESIYVKFKVDPSSVTFGGDKDNTYVVIWTTTPWTLPANLGVCFHPEFEYFSYRFGKDYFILAKGLLAQFEEVTGLRHDEEVALDPSHIKDLHVRHPFVDRESKVVFGNHVTLEQGTGIVHTAPGHGHDDYIAGLQNGLEIYCPVDDEGKFTSDFPEMEGVHVFKANPEIIKILESKNMLIQSGKIEHSYPHCWRCKKPLIYRATEQWFFGMDHNDLRKKGLKSVDETEWVPTWGETRFRGMVETRPDWCLSRQRSWGVPIPSFRCADCGKNLMTAESVQFFADLSRKEGLDAWYSKDIKDLVPAGTKCSCGSESLVKEFDILDVWFDSGVSHFAVLEKWEDQRWPADIYLEGSDQHRGWFQSSLWPALALRGRAPFNTVLTHGFMLDENGKAMSKSLGNVIPPEKIINQFGADIIRLWVSSEDYRNDVRIGMTMMNQVADSYRRIRNTLKYIIGNIADFNDSDAVQYEELTDIDKWILHKLYVLSETVIRHYEKFEFHLVYRKILNFCAVELSSIYFDISKDILYVEAKNSKLRLANLTVLKEIYNSIVRLIAPVLAFTTEEIWTFMGKEGSVHMETYYKLNEKYSNNDVHDRINQVAEIKKDVLKSLEILRKDKIIKTSLEAEITLYVKDASLKTLLGSMGEELRRFMQVAKVILADSDEGLTQYEVSAVSAVKSNGKKCARCWNFFDDLGSDPEHPELCERCTAVVKNL
ncbi:MAG TPA: isoleucine--tRNA ligase [Spirochaetota bacterium]|nr:isoleucine--tRNA ligase [Spirochaetota bacterium]HPJ34618.1 isoleucine--tRNA ligase [Spirochaetota bacterium]